jgi:hypothetical protein
MKLVFTVCHNDQSVRWKDFQESFGGFLQEGSTDVQLQELFRIILSAQRPEPGTRTTGENECFHGEISFILTLLK